MAMRAKKITVRFSASGYGSKTTTFDNWEDAVEFCDSETKEIAAEHDGEIEESDHEWVVNSRNGEEIARWEIL